MENDLLDVTELDNQGEYSSIPPKKKLEPKEMEQVIEEYIVLEIFMKGENKSLNKYDSHS